VDRIFLCLLHVTGVIVAEKAACSELYVLDKSQSLSAYVKGQWIMINAHDVASLGAGPKSRIAQLLLCAPLSQPTDPLPPNTDPEQISTGNKTTYSPDTFCSWAVTWQDTAFVFGVSVVLIWAWRPHWGHFCGLRECEQKTLRYLKTEGVVLRKFTGWYFGCRLLQAVVRFDVLRAKVVLLGRGVVQKFQKTLRLRI
jgi:hypothetical protein